MFAPADSLAATVAERVSALAAVYLFGSRAREDAGPNSDIDLAVLTLDNLDPVDRWKLQERVFPSLFLSNRPSRVPVDQG